MTMEMMTGATGLVSRAPTVQGYKAVQVIVWIKCDIRTPVGGCGGFGTETGLQKPEVRMIEIS